MPRRLSHLPLAIALVNHVVILTASLFGSVAQLNYVRCSLAGQPGPRCATEDVFLKQVKHRREWASRGETATATKTGDAIITCSASDQNPQSRMPFKDDPIN